MVDIFSEVLSESDFLASDMTELFNSPGFTPAPEINTNRFPGTSAIQVKMRQPATQNTVLGEKFFLQFDMNGLVSYLLGLARLPSTITNFDNGEWRFKFSYFVLRSNIPSNCSSSNVFISSNSEINLTKLNPIYNSENLANFEQEAELIFKNDVSTLVLEINPFNPNFTGAKPTCRFESTAFFYLLPKRLLFKQFIEPQINLKFGKNYYRVVIPNNSNRKRLQVKFDTNNYDVEDYSTSIEIEKSTIDTITLPSVPGNPLSNYLANDRSEISASAVNGFVGQDRIIDISLNEGLYKLKIKAQKGAVVFEKPFTIEAWEPTVTFFTTKIYIAPNIHPNQLDVTYTTGSFVDHLRLKPSVTKQSGFTFDDFIPVQSLGNVIVDEIQSNGIVRFFPVDQEIRYYQKTSFFHFHLEYTVNQSGIFGTQDYFVQLNALNNLSVDQVAIKLSKEVNNDVFISKVSNQEVPITIR